MLEALRAAYADLYARSEYAHLLPREKLRDLVVEITGLERENQIVGAIVRTFEALKTIGEVKEATKSGAAPTAHDAEVSSAPAPLERVDLGPNRNGQEIGMNLAYTINLNLPSTSDPEVFNAIFKALKEHLLGR